jgi:hypothetical protein
MRVQPLSQPLPWFGVLGDIAEFRPAPGHHRVQRGQQDPALLTAERPELRRRLQAHVTV